MSRTSGSDGRVGHRQPEATRRAYAERLGVPLHEFGVAPEAVAVVAVEKAQVDRSDEIASGNGSRIESSVEHGADRDAVAGRERRRGGETPAAGPLTTGCRRTPDLLATGGH